MMGPGPDCAGVTGDDLMARRPKGATRPEADVNLELWRALDETFEVDAHEDRVPAPTAENLDRFEAETGIRLPAGNFTIRSKKIGKMSKRVEKVFEMKEPRPGTLHWNMKAWSEAKLAPTTRSRRLSGGPP
jgi:hypothetical protein